jgi:transcriptional regulator with PAS, ATPase and Fis domain
MPIDLARLEELQIVHRIRGTVRRWWGVELSFTDPNGLVIDHGKGIVVPPQNRVCTNCLANPEGLRRCNQSIERAVNRLTRGTQMLGPCHMGLSIIGTPIQAAGERTGSLFACGFLVEEKAEDSRSQAEEESKALGLHFDGAAFDSVQRIEAREVPRLADLMDVTVEEIDAYQAAVAQREKRIRDLQRELGGRYRFADIVGKSEPMRRLYALLDKLVASDVTVLIHGENGTGKELIARALHWSGPRKDKEFVAQNCSALNDQLLESELFGHVKGSFTGATRDKPGLFKVADGGTFFLDEVADMSPAMQVKLLRVLQEGTFVPVGGTKPEKVDVRIIAASNKDLREAVVRREFREDLFYRLHVVALEVPALRERLDDLPMLVDHFLEAWSLRTGKPRKQLHPDLMAAFYDWSWPGNVRELQNEIERLCVLSGDVQLVPSELRAPHGEGAKAATPLASLVQRGLATSLQTAVGTLEKELIEAGLRETGNNKSKLAERLGVSRTTLIKKIRDYGIA